LDAAHIFKEFFKNILNNILARHGIAEHFAGVIIESGFLLIIDQRKLNDIFCHVVQKNVFLLCKDALKEEMLLPDGRIFKRKRGRLIFCVKQKSRRKLRGFFY